MERVINKMKCYKTNTREGVEKYRKSLETSPLDLYNFRYALIRDQKFIPGLELNVIEGPIGLVITNNGNCDDTTDIIDKLGKVYSEVEGMNSNSFFHYFHTPKYAESLLNPLDNTGKVILEEQDDYKRVTEIILNKLNYFKNSIMFYQGMLEDCLREVKSNRENKFTHYFLQKHVLSSLLYGIAYILGKDKVTNLVKKYIARSNNDEDLWSNVAVDDLAYVYEMALDNEDIIAENLNLANFLKEVVSEPSVKFFVKEWIWLISTLNSRREGLWHPDSITVVMPPLTEYTSVLEGKDIDKYIEDNRDYTIKVFMYLLYDAFYWLILSDPGVYQAQELEDAVGYVEDENYNLVDFINIMKGILNVNFLRAFICYRNKDVSIEEEVDTIYRAITGFDVIVDTGDESDDNQDNEYHGITKSSVCPRRYRLHV